MPQRSVFQAGQWWVVLLDSITQLRAGDSGMVAVTGSHGGSSAAAFALAVPLRLVVFNDAGIGKAEAGVTGLATLQAEGVPALTVSHQSARIGEAADTWENGVVSRMNEGAAALGFKVGQSIKQVLPTLVPRN